MKDAGFSLIEALVAMALLAVAATGLLQATARHLDTVAAIEARAAAGWSAENALTEARLGLPVPSETLLNRRWQAGIVRAASSDPALVALTVTARGGGVAGVIRGFVAKPQPQASAVGSLTVSRPRATDLPVDSRGALIATAVSEPSLVTVSPE